MSSDINIFNKEQHDKVQGIINEKQPLLAKQPLPVEPPLLAKQPLPVEPPDYSEIIRV